MRCHAGLPKVVELLRDEGDTEVQPEDGHSEVSAIDGRMYKAQCPKWQNQW
jgi:hypothetical protein